MDSVQGNVETIFGHRLRLRVSGLLVEGAQILLVCHKMNSKGHQLWSPPGGGMEYSLSAEDNLKKEFLEETGLQIHVEEFLFVHEYLSPPLHAVELFFKVKKVGGSLKAGSDPELKYNEQIIEQVTFKNFEFINALPEDYKHKIFKKCNNLEKLNQLSGYFM